MRPTAIAIIVLVTACSSSADDPAPPSTVAGQAKACEAVRRTYDVAVQAYEAVNGSLPPDLAALAGDFVEESTDAEVGDWFELVDGTVVPDDTGPC